MVYIFLKPRTSLVGLIKMGSLPHIMSAYLKAQFDVAIIGHRGFKKKYPENTLLAFQKAIDAKADCVELDVRLTKDGVLVVIHDKSTHRMTGKNFFVEKTDFATLRTLDFGLEEKIPTLEEVLELCKGKIGVHIELSSVGNAEPAVNLVSEFGMEKEVVFSSFVHSEIAKVKELNMDLPCAVLEPSPLNFNGITKKIFRRQTLFDNAELIGVEGINLAFPMVTKSICDNAHKNGLLVYAYTVDWPLGWRRLIHAGVDGIFTNDPESLHAFLSIESLKFQV